MCHICIEISCKNLVFDKYIHTYLDVPLYYLVFLQLFCSSLFTMTVSSHRPGFGWFPDSCGCNFCHLCIGQKWVRAILFWSRNRNRTLSFPFCKIFFLFSIPMSLKKSRYFLRVMYCNALHATQFASRYF